MDKQKALKHLAYSLFLVVAVSMVSCVSKVSIPDEEKPKLVIDLQMLLGSDDIIATVHTSNNLNGTYKIEHPEDVVIKVVDLEVQDNKIDFIYNADRNVYEFFATEGVLKSNKRFNLTAEILGSDIPKINAVSKVPMANNLVDTELVSTDSYINDVGQEFWQGTVRFNFKSLNTSESLYYQLSLNEKLQTKSTVDGDFVYKTISDDKSEFEIINVNSGGFAVKEFINNNGLWIDLDQLDNDEFFEIEIRSSFPIELEDQSSDNLFVNITSITEEHYNYYLGLNNIESSSSTLFNEKGLYRSNIVNGSGIFSTAVQTESVINLAQ